MANRREKLKADLAALAIYSPAQLRTQWARMTGKPLPKVSPNMLRLALGYELQAKALGGLPRSARQQLEQSGSGQTRTSSLVPGMRLVREWHGTVHIVAVSEDGKIIWNDREWRSLSAVARTITGTRWSGPAFFGLTNRKAAA